MVPTLAQHQTLTLTRTQTQHLTLNLTRALTRPPTPSPKPTHNPHQVILLGVLAWGLRFRQLMSITATPLERWPSVALIVPCYLPNEEAIVMETVQPQPQPQPQPQTLS